MSLFTELRDDPANLGYAALIDAKDDEGAAILLNTTISSVTASRLITARGILSDYPGGPVEAATVLDKLDGAAANIPALKWAWAFIKGDGIDIGHPATQGMIDALTTAPLGSVITAGEAANLKALALHSKSRSEILFGKQTAADEVARAVRSDDGTLLIGA